MSLFDLQDVCIAVGSLATLDLPMVIDLIGIYGLKGQYCMLITTNWFLQALSVIPRSTHSAASLSSLAAAAVDHHAAAAAPRRSCSGQLFEEFPSVLISSGLLVQADEGVSLPVVDLIDESTAAYREEPVFL
ncbi:nucleoprotein TPR [Dorcoceras hygrometricum]|uniref:Nucleoprotein TPR n=1 Tax=Dorcoceras hygrometricum TaxID=472368 RepID=A0A2Z7CSZ7_9LAMI|nr:nucleoprotein TPR [Dorcoceras hygrometricum]